MKKPGDSKFQNISESSSFFVSCAKISPFGILSGVVILFRHSTIFMILFITSLF